MDFIIMYKNRKVVKMLMYRATNMVIYEQRGHIKFLLQAGVVFVTSDSICYTFNSNRISCLKMRFHCRILAL